MVIASLLYRNLPSPSSPKLKMSLFSCPFGKHIRLHLQQAFKVDSTTIWMQVTQELISEGVCVSHDGLHFVLF